MEKTSAAGRNIPDDKLLVILRSLIDIVAFYRRDARGFSVPSVYYRRRRAVGLRPPGSEFSLPPERIATCRARCACSP
jgi:hypothetical protein